MNWKGILVIALVVIAAAFTWNSNDKKSNVATAEMISMDQVATLKVGDKARFVIPSDLAYRARGAGGVIPPNAVLIFDVELMGVK